MEKFKNLVSELSKAKSMLQVIEQSLKIMPTIVNCSNVLFTILDRSLINRDEIGNIILLKQVVEGKHIDLLGMSEIEMTLPAFSKVAEAGIEINNQQFISYPIKNQEGEVAATLQIQSKYIKTKKPS